MMLTLHKTDPIEVLSAADVTDVAADVIGQLPLRGIKGQALASDDILPVATLTSVNQSSVWKVAFQTNDVPCDHTVIDWLHTLQREKFEMAENILFLHLVLTILYRSGSRIVSVDFVDNPYY